MSMTESEAKRFADAHHDCKLVADGIVDDETFQKADSGLVLGYMREILEALEEIQQYRAIGTVEELKSMKENGAFSALEMVQIVAKLNKLKEYEDIGTVSEFRELKEKATAKKVQYDEYGRDEGYPHCSRCGDSLINDFVNVNYCPSCGQKLDWSEGKE